MAQYVVFFQGVDADNPSQIGLWVTNGTASGTFELAPIVGANASGLQPGNMANFNGEVLFEGVNAGGLSGLWVTNGTAAGTLELTSIAGASPSGLRPNDLTVSGIAGADPSGLDPTNLTVYNGVVLFNGLDSSGHPQLWETDGTVAGTHEVTGVVGASGAGLNPLHLTPATLSTTTAGLLWQNSDGQAAIWNISGGAPVGGGTVSPNPGPSWKAIGTGDFYDNGLSDILWQNANGQPAVWEMNGTSLIGGGMVGANPGSSWRLVKAS